MNETLIIGKGWLGDQLYNFLKEKGFNCKATVTSNSFNKQKNIDQEVYAYNLGESDVSFDIKNFDVIIFTIPPTSTEAYVKHTIEFFREAIDRNPDVVIYYTSSTSVYGNMESEIDEDTITQPLTINAKKISLIEEFLVELPNTRILRLGGLVGPKRHPVFSLSSRKEKIKNPTEPINLIHSNDISSFIYQSISKNWKYEIANLVCPEHPTKKAYYTFFANKLGLKQPEFEDFNERKGKIVISKVLDELGYTFEYKTPFEFKI